MRVRRDKTANIDAQGFGALQNGVQMRGDRLKGLNYLTIYCQPLLFLYLIAIKECGKMLNILNDGGKILSKLRRVETGIHRGHIPVGQRLRGGHETKSPSRSNSRSKAEGTALPRPIACIVA